MSVWIARIQDYKRSGLSIAKFCALHDLKASTFHGWIHRIAKHPKAQKISASLSATNEDQKHTQNLFQPLHITPDSKQDPKKEKVSPVSGFTASGFNEIASPIVPAFPIVSVPSASLRVLVGPFTLEIPKDCDLSLVQALLSILLATTPAFDGNTSQELI